MINLATLLRQLFGNFLSRLPSIYYVIFHKKRQLTINIDAFDKSQLKILTTGSGSFFHAEFDAAE